MPDYMLILRDHEERWERFSPEEFQRVIGMFAAWNQKLREAEQLIGAGKLSRDRGQTVRARDGELVVDGPFSEAKEAIGGYYCVRADDFAGACAIAKGCPILTYGGSVEVREITALLPALTESLG